MNEWTYPYWSILSPSAFFTILTLQIVMAGNGISAILTAVGLKLIITGLRLYFA